MNYYKLEKSKPLNHTRSMLVSELIRLRKRASKGERVNEYDLRDLENAIVNISIRIQVESLKNESN